MPQKPIIVEQSNGEMDNPTAMKIDYQMLRGNFQAGTTTAIFLIPQSMAYALVAGVPPVYGLYASLLPLMVYAVIGRSRELALGPGAL
ncbi:MAG: SulP family sulfate permease, partial [Dinoroseobacter sp.]